MGKKKSRMKRKMSTYMLLASKAKDMMTIGQQLKAQGALYSGGSTEDQFHKQIGCVFNSAGTVISVYSNSGIVGNTGIFQGATARRVSNLSIQGCFFSAYQVVPQTDRVIPAVQRTFNWVLVLLKNGFNIADCINNLNPPIFTPSLSAGAQQIVLESRDDETGEIVYSLGVPVVTVAQGILPSLKRNANDDGEIANSNAKRLRPLPNSTDPNGSINAQPIVEEIYIPRATVLASGTGVCIFNTTTVINEKFKACYPGTIDLKVDDQIVFVAKSASQDQYVSCNAVVMFNIDT